MTPELIRRRVMKVLLQHDPALAEDFEQCFVGERAPTDASWDGSLVRILTFAARCQECGKMCHANRPAVWIKGRGSWHTGCYKG